MFFNQNLGKLYKNIYNESIFCKIVNDINSAVDERVTIFIILKRVFKKPMRSISFNGLHIVKS